MYASNRHYGKENAFEKILTTPAKRKNKKYRTEVRINDIEKKGDSFTPRREKYEIDLNFEGLGRVTRGYNRLNY